MQSRIKKEQHPSILAENADKATSLTEVSKKEEYKCCLPPREQGSLLAENAACTSVNVMLYGKY